MSQPIIDPDKVNAWTESMRASFGGGSDSLSLWIVAGLTLVALLGVLIVAVRTARAPGPDPTQDLQHLIDAKPGAKAIHDGAPTRR
jgi:hypothetical protein